MEDDPAGISPGSIARLIVRMATQRDRAAFKRIFLACAPRIAALLQLRHPEVPAAVIEEICQETFTTTWQGAPAFDPRLQDGLGWLYGIANCHMTRALVRTGMINLAAKSSASRASLPISPEEKLASDAEKRLLSGALATLRPIEADLILDMYVRGLSHTQIAKRRDMPLGTVKSILSRAKDKLQVALAEARA